MADTFYIKRNDTSPAIKYQLDPKVDLTDASVVFNMARAGGAPVVNRGAAEIVGDPTDGIVSYSWSGADTEQAAQFRGEFEVTYADGEVETFPNDGYIRILITSDLG